jgi:hypothetical protein
MTLTVLTVRVSLCFLFFPQLLLLRFDVDVCWEIFLGDLCVRFCFSFPFLSLSHTHTRSILMTAFASIFKLAEA